MVSSSFSEKLAFISFTQQRFLKVPPAHDFQLQITVFLFLDQIFTKKNVLFFCVLFLLSFLVPFLEFESCIFGSFINNFHVWTMK